MCNKCSKYFPKQFYIYQKKSSKCVNAMLNFVGKKGKKMDTLFYSQKRHPSFSALCFLGVVLFSLLSSFTLKWGSKARKQGLHFFIYICLTTVNTYSFDFYVYWLVHVQSLCPRPFTTLSSNHITLHCQLCRLNVYINI